RGGDSVVPASSGGTVPTSAAAATPSSSPSSPEAERVLAAALTALRVGDRQGGIAGLSRALELDSGLATADLQLALRLRMESPSAALNAFQRAQLGHQALTDREASLLKAVKPCTIQMKRNYPECERRLGALIDALPQDAALRAEL